MLSLKSSHQGDTIVEVLIAMAIIGLILTVSYVTVNNSSIDERRSQERSEAVQLLQNQIEDLRYTVTNSLGTPPTNSSAFCFDTTTRVMSSSFTPITPTTNLSMLTPAIFPSQCTISPNGPGTQPEYFMEIVDSQATDANLQPYTYNATAVWYNAGGSGTDTANIAYRIEP